jgi:hypothetical protein
MPSSSTFSVEEQRMIDKALQLCNVLSGKARAAAKATSTTTTTTTKNKNNKENAPNHSPQPSVLETLVGCATTHKHTPSRPFDAAADDAELILNDNTAPSVRKQTGSLTHAHLTTTTP